MRSLMECSEAWRKLSACAVAAVICLSTLPQRVSGSGNEQKSTRPRRVAAEDLEYADQGPLMRIGLMSDVTSLSLGSSSKLVVRRSLGDSEPKQQTIAAGQMRVELIKPAIGVQESKTAYQVEVAAVSDSRRARKIAEEIKKKFYEASSTAYDEQAEKHRILIGRFATKSEAAELLDRLRKAGYSEARIAGQQQWIQRNLVATAASSREPSSPANTPAHQSSRQKEIAESRLPTGISAFEADKLIASSEDSLIVAAEQPKVENPPRPAGDPLLRPGAASPVRSVPAVRVANRDYRGEIHLILNRRGKINVINVVPLEEYLRGVVPMELSASFRQIEALKAQAVAARSYALYARGRYNNEGFDLYDDTRSQIYGGLTAEHPLTSRAVEETRGMVAVYPRDDGRLVPIEALYTANCGGHTENNEAIFLTKPVPYLREVKCEPNTNSSDHQIISAGGAPVEPLIGGDGRSKSRDVSLLRAAGFTLPHQLNLQYLRAPASVTELQSWVTCLAGLLGRNRPRPSSNERRSLIEFVRLVASAVYGEGSSRILLPASNVEYVLGGLPKDEIPTDLRADLAMLLKDGVLRLPAVPLNWQVTREYAIDTLVRAVYLKARSPSPSVETQGSKVAVGVYRSVALMAENNRLVVAAGEATKLAVQPSTSKAGSANIGVSKPTSTSSTKRETPSLRFDCDTGAVLFRKLGDETYPVERIPIRGGERVVYHLNSAGRIDFLEVELAEVGGNTFSGSGDWQERLTIDEVKRRLARFRISVGEIEDLIPVEYGASNRVIEMKVIGRENSLSVRGHQVRSALGLKESLFVIERERDQSDRVKAFVFTGRGWGHGVGLCQVGAVALAQGGYSYLRILQKYYTGVRVQRIY